MTQSLHPTDGARLLLEREGVSADGAEARYSGAIYTPDQRFEYEVVLGLGGRADLDAVDAPAASELEERLANIARSTARAAKRKQNEGLPPWPARILRWRGPGRG